MKQAKAKTSFKKINKEARLGVDHQILLTKSPFFPFISERGEFFVFVKCFVEFCSIGV